MVLRMTHAATSCTASLGLASHWFPVYCNQAMTVPRSDPLPPLTYPQSSPRHFPQSRQSLNQNRKSQEAIKIPPRQNSEFPCHFPSFKLMPDVNIGAGFWRCEACVASCKHSVRRELVLIVFANANLSSIHFDAFAVFYVNFLS